MVSGPDLGAGFLFQLSYDRDEDGAPSAFTFHAQNGGADANGPPLGDPEFLEYHHPPSSCMFGGPRCWERRFFLEEAALPSVRNAYGRTRFAMAALLAQQYEGRAVPFAAGFEEFLRLAEPSLRGEAVRFRVIGRSASWLRGGGATPDRLTVELAEGGAEVVGRQLEPFLVEPVAARSADEGIGGRAFLGTFQDGLRVDFGERPPGAGRATDRITELPFAGFLVPVAELTAPDNFGPARRNVA
jgi:hypothetical protein